MASSLVVPIVKIENVRPHPNADKLDLASVLGYQMAIPKGKYSNDDVVVYFPADTILTPEWIDKLGVVNFLKGKDKNRVGKIRLRGEASFGLIIAVPDGLQGEVGDNVAEFFGATKYEPPIKAQTGDAAPRDENIDPFFNKYTDIENGRIFVDVFQPGEEVIATEKIHGTNCRLGYVNGNKVAGSMGLRRLPPIRKLDMTDEEYDAEMKRNTYWFPWTIPSVDMLLTSLSEQCRTVVLYGEVFGGNVQNLNYGIEKGRGFGFRAFDLYVDYGNGGHFVDWDVLVKYCSGDIDTAPVLYRGPFDFDKIKEVADGKTTIGGDHIREGVVIKPVKERVDPKIGRAVLKYIGTEYELSKKSDSKDV